MPLTHVYLYWPKEKRKKKKKKRKKRNEKKTSWPEGGPTLDKEKRRKKERTSKLERGKSRIVTKKQNWIKS